MSKSTSESQTSEPAGEADLFVDEKAMFGTSPVTHQLSEDEVEYLTSRTAPRVILTRSRRKVWLYSSLFLYAMFFLRLIYHRAAPVTGMTVPDVYGLGRNGLIAACALIAAANVFLAPRNEKGTSAWWMMLGIGSLLPLVLLGVLFLVPPETVVRLFPMLF